MVDQTDLAVFGDHQQGVGDRCQHGLHAVVGCRLLLDVTKLERRERRMKAENFRFVFLLVPQARKAGGGIAGQADYCAFQALQRKDVPAAEDLDLPQQKQGNDRKSDDEKDYPLPATTDRQKQSGGCEPGQCQGG